MIRFTAAAAIALAALAAPAHAQLQTEEEAETARFRYLGIAGDFAVTTTEASGPETERRLTGAIANRTNSGPGGADNIIASFVIDCPGRLMRISSVITYDGDREILRSGSTSRPQAPAPGTANEMVFTYACTGAAGVDEERWITGTEAARQFAIATIHEN